MLILGVFCWISVEMRLLIGWIILCNTIKVFYKLIIKPPVETIWESAFGSTYFRDIYSRVNKRWYKNSWRKFDQLKNIDQKFYCSDYYASVNKYNVKCRTSLGFWENKGWINKRDPYGWLQLYFPYWLARRSSDDGRQINRWKRIISRFRSEHDFRCW